MNLSLPISNPWSPRLRRCVACLLVALCWAIGTGRIFAQEPSGAGMAGQSSSSTAGAAATPDPPTVPTPMTGTMLYPGDDFTLSPGDLIRVAIFLQPDYQPTVRLSAEGAAELPFIGSVPLRGLTVRAAQALIADRLRTGGFYRDPEVTIQVMDTVNGSVTITGEVRSVVPVANQRSLKEVLLLAGGLPANASHTVKIVRPGEPEPIVVDLGNRPGVEHHGECFRPTARHHSDHPRQRGVRIGCVRASGRSASGSVLAADIVATHGIERRSEF